MLGRGLDQALAHPGDPELRERHVGSSIAYLQLAERANGAIPRPMGDAEPWGDALEAWRALAPDVRLMNLETAVTRGADFAFKGVNYRMNPANVGALLAAQPDAVSLANNHVLDFGPEGLLETLDVLRAHGLASAGAGRTLAEAQAPAVMDLGRARVLFYAVAGVDSGVPPSWAAGPRSPGVALVEFGAGSAEALATRIAAERRPGDLAVVSVHWGSNWGYETPESHRRFAQALVESGAVAIVHGHSSHHPRPIEIRGERLILYGCGDFLNDYEGIRGYEEFRSDLAVMYFADVELATGALRALRLVPLRIRRFRLERAAAADADWLAATLTRESRPFGVRFAREPSGTISVSWVAEAPVDGDQVPPPPGAAS
jgi:poly-gamma-glutamate synthesis protein (capsule biosynthesis protein)